MDDISSMDRLPVIPKTKRLVNAYVAKNNRQYAAIDGSDTKSDVCSRASKGSTMQENANNLAIIYNFSATLSEYVSLND